ncbi:Na+/H+ antiporter NhaC [Serratia fonticola]|uniref:Na+/H+ antiporter NhaC n=1 Tax=Serratia fonticola TaxID=47917 RepID=A0A4V6KTS0_SERFO|nr:Na+/H+ antiporter NhaC [Serratia fonticola]
MVTKSRRCLKAPYWPAQLNGVELYKHIRTQLWTNRSSGGHCLLAFILLGLNQHSAFDATVTNNELTRFNELFHITPWNLLPLIFLLALSVAKVPASLAIMCSALMAGIMTSFMQPQVIDRFIVEPDLASPLLAIKAVWIAMATGFQEKLRYRADRRPAVTRRYGQHVADDLADHRSGDVWHYGG